MSTRMNSQPSEYLVRVSREMVDRLIADDSEPVVIVRVVEQDDGSHEMHLMTTDVISERRRLREACAAAYEALTSVDTLGPDCSESAVESARMVLADAFALGRKEQP